MGSLDHMAKLKTSSASEFSFSLAPITVLESKTYSCAKLILFSVIVPVLSVQITVALPNVSTVLVCLVIMPIFIKRQAPNAMNVVNATGISSGITLIAIVSAFSKLSKTTFE